MATDAFAEPEAVATRLSLCCTCRRHNDSCDKSKDGAGARVLYGTEKAEYQIYLVHYTPM